VELNPDAHYAVGVNIRVSGVEAVLLDLLGDIGAETTLPPQGGMDPASLQRTVVEAVDQVIRLAHVDPGRVLGVGVGFPGPIGGGRIVAGSPGLPGWQRIPLAEQLEPSLGLPVTLENDANLAALAEFRFGAGTRDDLSRSLVYIYADYGIGAGIVVDGKLYRGADGLAGELGHTVIDVDGPQCTCGNYGCLETLASIGAIVRRTVAAAKLGGATCLAERFQGDWDAVTYSDISQAIMEGDALASAALDDAVAYLAVGISNVIRQFRPEAIVLGGQIFFGGPDVFARLQSALNHRSSFYGVAPTPLALGDLGMRAPAIGAAGLVLENFFGVPQQVMSSEPHARAAEPAFERVLVWPRRAEDSILLMRGNGEIRSAGNLQPAMSRVRSGDSVTVTVDVELALEPQGVDTGVKALLHWDRVALFGGHWPSPRNSPMQLLHIHGRTATYSVTLGALPPGKYEFAAHVLGHSDVWVRAESPAEQNGRLEVLPNRAFSSRNGRANRQPTDGGEDKSAVETSQAFSVISMHSSAAAAGGQHSEGTRPPQIADSVHTSRAAVSHLSRRRSARRDSIPDRSPDAAIQER
jgi:predicted NBD/HSP70 family sugar kinase